MRQRMPLSIGRGMDRATGTTASQPQFPLEAVNVYARDSKMAVRSGTTETGYPDLDWGTHLLAIIAVKATHDVLYVIYDDVSRDIRVYRLDTDTSVLQTIASPVDGEWGTLSVNADFPVVGYDEADGKVFIAHEEDDISLRLPTIYYTPNFVTPSTVGTLTTLTADLDGSGVAQNVYFRGVRAHLEYMCGWGFGSNSDQDRGDVLRFSKPAAPTTWIPSSYVLFGVKREPIVAAIPVDGGLAVLKEGESWMMDGAAGSLFVPRKMDPHYGASCSRGVISDGTVVRMWSKDGPRQITSNGTFSIGQPLELISPLPDDLPVRGPVRLGFAVYDVNRYLLEWIFPDIEADQTPVLSFALSLWNREDPRWTFFVREQKLTCAGVLLGTDFGGAPEAPIGYPSTPAAVDA